MTLKKIGILDPHGKHSNPLNNQKYSDTYKVLSKFWSGLPAYKSGPKIIKALESHDVLLIKAGTGSGKSVTVPKFCLHANNYKGQVVMTLPKKIITKKAAEFASQTLDVELGEYVGYQFRGENMKSNKTVLLYSTDGSIISMIRKDPLLSSIDIIIIDEAHERKIQIDLLIYFLKNAVIQRKNTKPLKLVIMSATINDSLFKQYFKSHNLKYKCLELDEAPNYPITSYYLDSKLNINENEYVFKGKCIVKTIVEGIGTGKMQEGDILFFVCTIIECVTIAKELEELYPDCFTMGLYSGFDKNLEQYISSPTHYKELNPRFERRIFVSTNVAESSLTIDGIRYVIDSGLEMTVKFNPEKNINIMTKSYISQAQMIQRKGRAGRTSTGTCYHLYTKDQEKNTCPYPESEIKRVELKNVCLSLLKLCKEIKGEVSSEYLKKMFDDFIEPPLKSFVLDGINFLVINNLVDNNFKLQKLSELVLDSKLDIRESLSLYYAYQYVKISGWKTFYDVFKIICVCSMLKSSIKELFNSDIGEDEQVRLCKKLYNDCGEATNNIFSEHVVLLCLYNSIEKDSENGDYNLELFGHIQHLYERQLGIMKKIYSGYGLSMDGFVTGTGTDNDYTRIVKSFSFGYKTHCANRSGTHYKYNGLTGHMNKKSIVKFNSSVPTVIFYSNMSYMGKLNLVICSEYIE